MAAAESTPDIVVEHGRGQQYDTQVARSDQSSQHKGHTAMEMNEEHGLSFQSSAEHAKQTTLYTAAATVLKSAGAFTPKPTAADQHGSISDPTHDAQEEVDGKPMQEATVATMSAGTHVAKLHVTFQDSSRYQPSQKKFRCPENIPMQVAELQHVPACTSRPGEHSPGTSLEASATAFSADTPDELDLDGDDSLLCAQQAQRVQQSPLEAMPDRSVTQPTTGKSTKAPSCDISGKTTGSVPVGPQSVSKGGGVSMQPAAKAPSRCLPAAQEWKSNVGEASAQQGAQTTSAGLIAPQDINMHRRGSVAGRATIKPNAEQGNEKRGLARELCEPNAKKPRTLQPDVESRHAAQNNDEPSLGREPLEPIAKEPCRAQPDVESKDAALCQVGEVATSTNAGAAVSLLYAVNPTSASYLAFACMNPSQLFPLFMLLRYKHTSSHLCEDLFTL